jgi:hypothetical protein
VLTPRPWFPKPAMKSRSPAASLAACILPKVMHLDPKNRTCKYSIWYSTGWGPQDS